MGAHMHIYQRPSLSSLDTGGEELANPNQSIVMKTGLRNLQVSFITPGIISQVIRNNELKNIKSKGLGPINYLSSAAKIAAHTAAGALFFYPVGTALEVATAVVLSPYAFMRELIRGIRDISSKTRHGSQISKLLSGLKDVGGLALKLGLIACQVDAIAKLTLGIALNIEAVVPKNIRKPFNACMNKLETHIGRDKMNVDGVDFVIRDLFSLHSLITGKPNRLARSWNAGGSEGESPDDYVYNEGLDDR